MNPRHSSLSLLSNFIFFSRRPQGRPDQPPVRAGVLKVKPAPARHKTD